MRKAILVFASCLCQLSTLVYAIPLDITNAGMEVVEPLDPNNPATSFILRNGLVGSDFYWGKFRWNSYRNVFQPTGEYGLEDPTFKASEYYPLHIGDTWTYRCSDGGTLTRTVTGTEEVCGVTCMRLENSDGGAEWWVSDDTGVWLAKTRNPDGSHVVFCPLRLCNPHPYIGFSKLTPYEDIPIYDPLGTLVGSMTGYFSYTGNTLETVVTPAGTFVDCFRGNLMHSFSNPWTANILTDEVWFAHGVGPVKQISTEAAAADGSLFSTFTEVLILESATVGGVSYP